MILQRKLSSDNIKKYILDIFFPNRCPFCGRVIKWNEHCCEKCLGEIPFISKDICERCGKEDCVCNDKDNKLYYDGCVSIVYYSGIMKTGILNFKLDKGLNLVDVFEDYIFKRLSKAVDINNIDIVTAVPMNKAAKHKRGYNQSDIIAEKVSKIIQKPLKSGVLMKSKSNITQHELNRYERAQAVKGLFSADARSIDDVSGKVILLCDDIITTGSTLNECARILKQNGARSVYCFTIAYTPLENGRA